MSVSDLERLRSIKTFPSLMKYLRDELDWPIDSGSFEDLTFEYEPEELGLDPDSAVKVKEIKQLRPLVTNQPWGIFFINFEPKRLPVVVLRRILRMLVVKKRQSAEKAQRASWHLHDLMFISSYGESDDRSITFAHFSEPNDNRLGDLPTLQVLGWDAQDTPLHLAHAHNVLREKLHWPQDDWDVETWRQQWSEAFALRHREVITTSKELAIRLAELAKRIRKRANLVIKVESERGPLRKLYAGFKTALIHDLSEDDFADMYAQTIAYGLLAARVSRPVGVIADDLADMVPITNPFLREMLGTFLTVGGRKGKIDFDELGIQEIVDLLNSPNTHLDAVLRDFGNRTRQEDPVVHFYELFLKEYDKKKKVERGVFYTPQPVVSYIVRSVHELLQSEFDIADGLGSTVTWGDMFRRHPEIKIPKDPLLEEPFVQILDPATGTATFLVEVIDVIYKTMMTKWQKQGLSENQCLGAWNEYVPKHLLPRLHGFELMMAPYTIAHMKVGLKLFETGYRFGSNERVHIYLTNSLEPPQDFSKQLDLYAPALAHEAQAVNFIKRNKRFTVILGNPPYSIQSQNLTDTARAWVDPYRYVDGELIREKGALQFEKSLQDDCVKFASYSQQRIIDSSSGILGLIMSHSFVDNPTLRGMRQHLGQSFNNIFVFDLHGNSTKKERCPDGSEDKNVFDIKQGVGILIGTRQKETTPFAAVGYAEAWGTREMKYALLERTSIVTTEFHSVAPTSPFYLFKPQSAGTRDEFDCGLKITEIFIKGNVGIITARDNMVIDFEARPLIERAKMFRDSNLSDEDLCAKLKISLKKGWDIGRAREIIKQDKNLEKFIKPLCYRPFDSRLIFYHPALVWGMSYPTMQHMISGGNLAMMIGRAGQVIGQGQWDIVFCTRSLTEFNLYRRGGHNLLPLYLVPGKDGSQAELAIHRQRQPNLSPEFLKTITKVLGLRQSGKYGFSQNLTPEDIFHYAYAVFYSPGYRSRYAEFLKIDFPRLLLTGNLKLFQVLTQLGGELVALHLLESPKLDKHLTKFIGSGHPEIEKVSWSDNTVWIDEGHTQGFRGVPENVWNFHIGGYQICHKWLDDRRKAKRTLSHDDIMHYHRIVVALNETIRLMAEIDKVIDAHGGWPGAFLTQSDEEAESTRGLLAAENQEKYKKT